MASPNGCRVVTELMPTWRNLWTQRLRWQRGALENLGAYGPAPASEDIPTDPAWLAVLNETYGFTSPDVS